MNFECNLGRKLQKKFMNDRKVSEKNLEKFSDQVSDKFLKGCVISEDILAKTFKLYLGKTSGAEMPTSYRVRNLCESIEKKKIVPQAQTSTVFYIIRDLYGSFNFFFSNNPKEKYEEIF